MQYISSVYAKKIEWACMLLLSLNKKYSKIKQKNSHRSRMYATHWGYKN